MSLATHTLYLNDVNFCIHQTNRFQIWAVKPFGARVVAIRGKLKYSLEPTLSSTQIDDLFHIRSGLFFLFWSFRPLLRWRTSMSQVNVAVAEMTETLSSTAKRETEKKENLQLFILNSRRLINDA